jgi:hypothetical protein
MDHHPPHALADPVPDRAIGLKLQQFTASQPPHALVGSPSMCAELDRCEVAVVLQAVYEWGGYRYTNASDAIAAAKRGRK